MFLTSTTDVINEPIASLLPKFFDALKTGSVTAILGMIIVFAVLAIIFVALVVMRKILGKKSAPIEKAPAAPKTDDAPAAVEQAPVEEAEPETDDGAVIAAIIAAISAYTGKSASGFRVVSFKRRH